MRARIGWTALACVMLCGCAMSDEKLGAYVADPANYEVMTCEQLAASDRAFTARLTELDGLMQKASQGTGGGVVNAIAYRPEHIAARGSLDAVHRVEREKNCKDEAAAPVPATASLKR